MEPRSLKPPAPSVRRRWLNRLVGFPVLVYGGVVLVFFGLQTRLIFPGSATQGTPESVVTPPSNAELVHLSTPQGEKVVALFGAALQADGTPRADASTCPTMLYFHGNAMCLNDSLDQFRKFRRLGINVMIPDYLGYGMSEGKPGELGCREAAQAALAHLRSRPDLDQRRVIAAGWSLGGAVAIDLASRHPVAGVATFSSFTSMPEMARRLFPILPTSPLLRHRFDSLSKVARLNRPMLIGHGRGDRIIPFDMADRLAAAAKGPVTRITIDEADHNDFFQVGGDRVESALQRFVEALPARR